MLTTCPEASVSKRCTLGMIARVIPVVAAMSSRSSRWETGASDPSGLRAADDHGLFGVGAPGRGGDHADGEARLDAGAVGDRRLQHLPARALPRLLPGERSGQRGAPKLRRENRGAGLSDGRSSVKLAASSSGPAWIFGFQWSFTSEQWAVFSVGVEIDQRDRLLGFRCWKAVTARRSARRPRRRDALSGPGPRQRRSAGTGWIAPQWHASPQPRTSLPLGQGRAGAAKPSDCFFAINRPAAGKGIGRGR